MMGSMYFQNVIGPKANMSFAQLLISMKQKSPELEIPEGVFYDGIPQTNLYVQKKDPQTGMLYGMMIFRQTESFEDAAIILADSGMMQSTAEKKHLLLTLHSGEWFENMRGQDVASANVPYRRETFSRKRILLDFDADFNLTDVGLLSSNAKAKSLEQIKISIDSMNHEYDSIGRVFYRDVMGFYFCRDSVSKADSLRAVKMAATNDMNIDTVFNRLSPEYKQRAMTSALGRVNRSVADQEYKELITEEGDYVIRQHHIEAWNKYTLALSCLIFFFIGAPLGAIIRKGGLGIPVIISVLVFIVYYIFDNTGYRMARGGMWAVWFGKSLPTAVLTPVAVFFTYKANNDSVMFNIDLYRTFFMKLLGLRLKRHVLGKEVIIQDPDYDSDRIHLLTINDEITAYAHDHKLMRLPNVVKVFFRYEDDREMERIVDVLESTIEDLQNTRDKKIITELNNYPIVSTRAHTRVFNRRWMNIVPAIILPVGIIIYLRMWRFRLRLYRDLKAIKHANTEIIGRIEELRNNN
jgi:lipopolysaccharide export system permease protein